MEVGFVASNISLDYVRAAIKGNRLPQEVRVRYYIETVSLRFVAGMVIT